MAEEPAEAKRISLGRNSFMMGIGIALKGRMNRLELAQGKRKTIQKPGEFESALLKAALMRQSTAQKTTKEQEIEKQEAERPTDASAAGDEMSSFAIEGGKTRDEGSDDAGSSSYSKSSTTNLSSINTMTRSRQAHTQSRAHQEEVILSWIIRSSLEEPFYMQKFLLSLNQVAEFKKVAELAVTLQQKRRGFSIRHTGDLLTLQDKTRDNKLTHGKPGA